MKYLKKEIVIQVINMSEACRREELSIRQTQSETHGGGLVQKAKGVFRHDKPERKAFVRYLKKLPHPSLAELTALMWLGKDSSMDPESWDELVEKARQVGTDAMCHMPVKSLPRFLRLGMERLARLAIIKKKDNRADEQRYIIVGKYTINAFRQKYGKDAGLRKLFELMDSKGHLQKPQDRELFLMLFEKPEDNLEMVLREVHRLSSD